MRILYHHRTQCLDGQRVHIREIQDALRAQGHEVLEVSPVPAHEAAGETPVPTWRRRCLTALTGVSPPGVYELLELGYNAVACRNLARAIRRFRPDFLYERYALNTVAGAWVSRRFGVPLLLEVNSPLAEEKRRLGQLVLHGLARRLENDTLRQATRVLAVTGVLRRTLIEQAGLDPERVLVVQNGVRPEAFDRPAAEREARRQALDLRGRLLVGAVGFFRPWHGIDLLLRCVARNPVLRERVHVLLVGENPGLPEEAARLGIAGQVTFAGSVPHAEVPSYLAAMDIGLIPRAVEYASPLKLFEYLAAGMAILAPRQENLMEILTEGEDAVCFTPEDAAGLEASLLRLVQDEGLRRRLGAAARQTIHRRGLTWAGNAARIVQAFEELRAARPAAAAPAEALA
ncbi:MAG TPA: glycosyltransferase family 4 protein [Gemmataceae bacterium]|nr:glycosyltransferase family 4 protein [Gemmataceae bacterium]